jgi:hypothetical protein
MTISTTGPMVRWEPTFVCVNINRQILIIFRLEAV